MSFFSGFRNAATSLTMHGDDIQSIIHPLKEHLDNSLGWLNNDAHFNEIEHYPNSGVVEHHTRVVGNYIVSTLKHVGNRGISQDVRKTASIFSSVPNHAIQGYRDSDSTYYHVMTRLAATGSGVVTSKEAAAVHAMNTYIVASAMRSSHVAQELGKGRLRDKNQYDSLRPGTPLEDRGVFHYAQYTGNIDLSSGTISGEEFYIIRNTPDRARQSALVGRWADGVETLRRVFGLPHSSKSILHDYAERVRRSSVNLYENLVNFDGTEARIGDQPVANQGVRSQFVSRVLDEGDSNTLINDFYGPRAQPVQLVSDLSGNNISSFSSQHIPIPDPTPYDASTQSSTIASAAAQQPTSQRQRRQTQPVSQPTSTPQPASQPTSTSPEPPVIDTPLFSESGFSFTPSWGSNRDAYLSASPDSGTSRTFTPVEVDRNLIQVISPEEFKRLETQFALGGIEHRMPDPFLRTTERSIEALSKLRGLMNGFGLTSDADENFYRRVGSFALPSNNFEVRKFNDYDSINPFVKKRMELAGAYVGTNADGYDIWLLDDPGQTNQHVSSILSGNQPSRFQQHSFNLGNSPTPSIDLDPRNWEIVNVPGMSARQAAGHGFMIPIKGNKAMFVPSFANPDFTFGLEFETGIHTQVQDILNGVQHHFGYDLTKFGFHGDFDSVHDHSIHGGGREYLTPVMSGIRAFKATYLFGEGLQLAGATETPTWPISSGRNDPSGIHVNVGSIPQENRKTGIQFMADYIRLVEDVYKRMSGNDARYRYYGKRGGFPYTSGGLQSGAVVPELLSAETRATPESEHARQFWAQSMSDVRRAGTSSGMSEYEFYRSRGTHYAPVTSVQNLNYGVEKLAKYKTVAVHKLMLQGIMEFRPPMYRPGGSYAINQMVLASKMAGDLYLGAMGIGDFALTDKLVPPNRGWDAGEDDIVRNIAKHIFGIEDPIGQDFMVKLHRQCSAS